ncbi:MAG: hypothetical protein ACP5R5_00740 [Armatimonadota bacterium]
MKYIGVWALAVLIAAFGKCAVAQQSDVEITVTAEGQAAVINGDVGRAEDEALTVAKRNAVEAGIGVFVKSESLGRNFDLVEQTILTRSEGYVSWWEIIPGSRKIQDLEGSKMLTIKIKAKVKAVTLVNALSDIEAIYESIQRPKVMVLMNERNIGQKPEDLPVSALAIMRVLQEKKFDVVDPEIIKRLIAKESARAIIERGDPQAAAMLAMQEGAEILVLGSAKASEQKIEELGDTVKAASAILSARIVYSDTGDVLYTSKQISGRGVSTSSLEEAGIKALDDAGAKLLNSDTERFVAQVIARWANEAQSGRVFKVTADNVSYNELNALKKVISEFRGHIGWGGNSTYTGRTGTIYVKSRLTPDQFRERLAESKVAGKRVEITNVAGTTTVIQLKGGVAPSKPAKSRR